MTKQDDIVVIGAGIVGVTTALSLLKKGFAVRLIDEHEPGMGASFGNAGLVSVDSCIPIALPGMLRQVPKWLLDSTGPLTVKPSYLPKASKWLWQWVRSGATLAKVSQQSQALRRLHKPAFDLYKDLLGNDFHRLMTVSGQIHVWEQSGPASGQTVAERLRAESGIFPRQLNAGEIRDLVPTISPTIKHGEYYENNGFVANPHSLVQALFQHFIDGGGKFLQDKITGLIPSAGPEKYRIITATNNYVTNQLVISAGAWSKHLLSGLGVRMSLETERGYHLSFDRSALDLSIPVIHKEKAFAITPFQDSVRIAGFVEIAGLNAPPQVLRENVLQKHLRSLFPTLQLEKQNRFWLGFRPSSPDSLPFVGPVTGYPGLYVGVGHGHTGLTGAPMTANILSSLIAGEASPVDISSFNLQRF